MDSHICAFLAGCATVAYVWHSFSQHLPRDENGPDASSTLPSTDKEQAVLLREQLTRNFQFFGDHGMLQIQNAFIVVVGLGGVGSHAAVHLLRSGVGRLRLVDFDQVTLSSLNRHAVAELADVGTPKVVAVQRFARRVVPLCPVEACVEMFSAADADRLLADTPDFVLDCIDNIDTKVDLLRLCHERGIKVLLCYSYCTLYCTVQVLYFAPYLGSIYDYFV
jgi:tRNA A37 threonylcarbamoyladenosine dehydratase